ncbi:MAG TPA: RHS repeat-associated core domain-containing protein [Solirubrobacterales bacterium]|nr:RHS repeat-associated core domain-containing protein [Solirubrobacterales bacterium]
MTLRARAVAACLLALFSLALATTYALACPIEPPIPDENTWGDDNAAAPPVSQSQCKSGRPVNCASGNQYEEQTDLVLGGRGPGLHLTRTYNSQAAAEAKEAGPWGYGWSGPYSSHLEINEESGAVTVVQENGATAAFALVAGKYVAGDWIQATLVKEGESYFFTLPSQEILKFNSKGQLTEQKDRNGNYLTFFYESGKLKSVKDAAGRLLILFYTGSQVASVLDPMANVIKYGYESGNLSSVTLPGEVSPRWKFKYDASHQLTEMTDGRGGITKTEYDEKHRVKKQTDPAERVLKFEYGESGGKKTTTITQPNGSTTFEKFNEAGEPLEVIRAKGTGLERKTTYEYSEAYELIKATDALGHSTTFEYSAAGDKTLEKDAEGNEAKWTYNGTHDVETETTPMGEKTTYKRDANGNVETVERPAPGATTQKSTFKHAVNGDLESATNPLGRETKFEYDSYGDLKAATDPEGDKTTWTYDKNGQQLTEVSPRGNEEGAKAEEFETKTERDGQGRPIKVTDPLGHETKVVYDKNGNIESTTDALSHTTKYTYNADDERTKVELANGNTTETAYDSMGQVKSRTNGNGYATKYERDTLGQLTEAIDPLERKSKREYDGAGRLKKTEDALGRTISYTYDNADRLTKLDYSEASTTDVTYKYDKDGNITEMTDGTGTTTRTFDQLDRLTEVKNGAKEVVKYKYDLGNQKTEITYPNGETVKQTFDKAGRLEKVTDWLGKETTFSYNRDSQVKATTFPSATTNVDEYSYNRDGQMSEVSMKKKAEVLASMSYTRDKLGQIEKAVETGFPEEPERKYEYDTRNRLIKSNTTAFEYDKANNITKNASATYTYDKGDQIATASTGTFEFNKLGQRTKSTPTGQPATTYAYDQTGNLTSVKRPAEGEVTEISNTFKYDGTGLRTTETNGASTYPMAWDTTSALPLLLHKGNDYYVYGPEGLPFEQIISSSPHYLHHDQLGSTRILTSSTGAVIGSYRYGPFGSLDSFTGTQSTQIGYAGQYRSHTSRLIYLRARTYDPATAQFLSPDPLVVLSGETYAYAADNPINAADPAGLLPDGCGCPPPPCPSQDAGPSDPPKDGVGRQIKEEAAKGAVEEMLKGESPWEVVKGAGKSAFWAGVEALEKRLEDVGDAADAQVVRGFRWIAEGWSALETAHWVYVTGQALAAGGDFLFPFVMTESQARMMMMRHPAQQIY